MFTVRQKFGPVNPVSGFSTLVMVSAAPPSAEMRRMPAGVPYRIVPSVPQVPPKNEPSSAPISCGGVPAAATFFNRPPATKPIELLSGDQKG